MLGEPPASKDKHARKPSEVDSSKIIIANNEEKISNSSSPMENENLTRQQEQN